MGNESLRFGLMVLVGLVTAVLLFALKRYVPATAIELIIASILAMTLFQAMTPR